MVKFSKTLPLFPLGGALLLPSGNLPLNIFEPRYISMVNYALGQNKMIGMIQPKKNNSKELFNIGCVGKITSYSETDDNRYIINLRGMSKFKIKNEIKHLEKFRLFHVDYENNKSNFNKFDIKLFNKNKFIEKIKYFFKNKGMDTNLESIEQINEKSLIIMTAMISPFSINEKQMLLECENINKLADTVVSLFDFEINRSNSYETIN